MVGCRGLVGSVWRGVGYEGEVCVCVCVCVCCCSHMCELAYDSVCVAVGGRAYIKNRI